MSTRAKQAASTRAVSKLQRWIDLIAALLRRHYPITLEDIVRDVPGYQQTSAATRRRMFERDKAELRRLGVPIQTIALDDGDSAAYQLRTSEFYLPYLSETGRHVRGSRGRVDHYGYRSLPTLVFEPEELRFVFLGAKRIELLRAGSLSESARAGLKKLRFDLGSMALHSAVTEEETILLPRAAADPGVIDTLIDASRRRKRIEIDYYSIGVDELSTRAVEPYGLFLVGGNWYLAAHDAGKDALRTFRVSRISDARTNKMRPGQADFRIPATFAIREYVRSRQAWEIGEDEALRAIVEFKGDSGTLVAGTRLGRVVGRANSLREFDVRRVDAFARWLLSFGGQALPKSPPAVVYAFHERVRAALVVYSREPAEARHGSGVASHDVTSRERASVESSVQNEAANAQLLRLFVLLPVIGAQDMVDLGSAAAKTGIAPETILQDLRAVSERLKAPAGYIDPIQVYLEGNKIGVVTSQFLRPPRLNHNEVLALELGLAMLRRESTPDDYPWIDRARVRLRAALTRADPASDAAEHPNVVAVGGFGAGSEEERKNLQTLRAAFTARRKAKIEYSTRASTSARIIRLYALAYASGAWYVIAHCDDRSAIRRFRLDRIRSAEMLEEKYSIPSQFELASEIGRDRVVSRAPDREILRVRFGPCVARWIAERERCDVASDGSVVVEYPLLDLDWAVAYVLQYGADAEVLAPASVRNTIRERLERMAATSVK